MSYWLLITWVRVEYRVIFMKWVTFHSPYYMMTEHLIVSTENWIILSHAIVYKLLQFTVTKNRSGLVCHCLSPWRILSARCCMYNGWYQKITDSWDGKFGRFRHFKFRWVVADREGGICATCCVKIGLVVLSTASTSRRADNTWTSALWITFPPSVLQRYWAVS